MAPAITPVFFSVWFIDVLLYFLLEAVLLAALGVLDPAPGPAARGPVLVLGLSFLMGLQKARAGVPARLGPGPEC